ncbi:MULTISPECIES: glycosyltransferase [unclassified Campylobacter]|uniref:glycosyltransferase n=1 Tax=unclassified Campylobacter TaxID=2593542 RepID=UPI0022E99BE8|nr:MULTISPECIES: glycosyltransferase [unclassified Campylobacter]MDA3079225.1 glycosyltransferase [Campylobacter sp. CS_NA2]MDA3080472.1 glycosyltransferase [Campylobacter sp. CS_NA1]MDA3085323.1 glycosyltransferase [Campylobacter sp. CS_ED1]MDA3090100.1 glycosyltransferase [Campylobacter sp. CS_ED2]WBR51362.1 glycosyltransferase [Campylobacter sp. CS_NA3]
MNFSVLMSVYIKEKAEFLDRALRSIYDEQEVKPNQIVLVEDGELTDELYAMIKIWKDKLGEILEIVKLEKNMGLGDALRIGLEKCKFEMVARMDSDDISLPNRFKKQLEVLNKNPDIDVCGSNSAEFTLDENSIFGYAKLPEKHSELIKFSKIRCPFRHPSVMFKKTSVLKAGSYQNFLFMEDYYLWVRMILASAKFYNIQEPLIKVRANHEQLIRRSGLKYAITELKVQREFYKLGFLNFYEFLRNASVKFTVRLLPKAILSKIYSFLRSKN